MLVRTIKLIVYNGYKFKSSIKKLLAGTLKLLAGTLKLLAETIKFFAGMKKLARTIRLLSPVEQ